MKAVLLVGGEGTRLRPLTYDVPKPLVPVANLPYLEQLMKYLRRFGVDEIILTACYLSEQIKAFCKTNIESAVKLTYVIEESPLGTGGAVGNVADFLHETFLVFNGDIVTDFDLHTLIAFHREKKAKATLALATVSDPTRYGVVDLLPDGDIHRFVEKPKKEEAPSCWINAGIYVMEPAVLSLIPRSTKVSIEREVFPQMAETHHLSGKVFESYWLDMGTPADYLAAHHDYLDGKISLEIKESRKGKNWIGERVTVASGAKLISPVLIGSECEIGQNAVVGPYTVLGEGCNVEEGAKIERSVLWNKVRVGREANVDHTIIGHEGHVETKAVLEHEIIRGAPRKLGAPP